MLRAAVIVGAARRFSSTAPDCFDGVIPAEAGGHDVIDLVDLIDSMTDEITTDVLVVGGGMAGLSAGASLARAGASVMVLERSDHPGGSAALSGGYVWTATSVEEMRAENPLGDRELGDLVVSGFADGVDWIASLGVVIGRRFPIYFGEGYQLDIRQYLQRCLSIIEDSGYLLRGASVRSLIRDDSGRVLGATVQQQNGRTRVKAAHTILATGGFQANPALRARYIHRNARAMLLRSNPNSRGDGLRLGLEAGAGCSQFMDGFYGHLMPSPLMRFGEPDFGPLSQYLSECGLLINSLGERFTDESARDSLNNQAVVRQPRGRAWLVVDEAIRKGCMGRPHIQGQTWIDRFASARAAGANYAELETLSEVAVALSGWGVDGATFLRTVGRYNSGVLLRDDPPRRDLHQPLREPPFHVLEVQPAITFTHGGLRIDRRARALDEDGKPIPGLLVAGSDAGGVYHKMYAGGLAVALVLAREASKTVAA